MTSSSVLLPRRIVAGVFVVSSLIIPASPWGASSASARHQEPPRLAQSSFDDGDIPAHIAIVDGTATVERDGRIDSALENDVVLAGDRFRTGRGRLEVMFADGSVLDVDQDSDIDLLSESLMRLRTGRVRLCIPGGAQSPDYRVDATLGSVLIRTAGDYRIAVSNLRPAGAELDVAAFHGLAALQNAAGRTLVRAGTHARAVSESQPSVPYAFNSAALDGFDRWSEDQRDARLGSPSSSYLPQDVRYYGGELDRTGSWGYEPTYGQVWYPTVAPGWQPYSAGQWSFAARIGWFWIGVNRWSWPTHHYGRWGLSASRWFWIPGPQWGPAWVSWASAPGYVGWCPLGYDGRPVIGIADYSSRRGWTVLPSHSFVPHVPVSRYVVDGRSLPISVRGSLATRGGTPIPYDASSAALPIRGPAAFAQRRDSAVLRSGEPSITSNTRDGRAVGGPTDARQSQIAVPGPNSNGPLRAERSPAQAAAARPASSPVAATVDRIPRTTGQLRTYDARSAASATDPTSAATDRIRVRQPPAGNDTRPFTAATAVEPRGFERSRIGTGSGRVPSVGGQPSSTVADRQDLPPSAASQPGRPSYAGTARRSPPPPSVMTASPRPDPAPRQSGIAPRTASDRADVPVSAPSAREAGSSSGSSSRPSSADQGRAVPRGRGGR